MDVLEPLANMEVTQNGRETVTTTTPSPPRVEEVNLEINSSDTLTYMDYIQYGLYGTMNILAEIFSYLTSSGVILTHVITFALFYSLVKQGASVNEVTRAGIIQEVVTIILWYFIPNSFATIAALFVSIYLYETLFGPKVVVRENAQILTSDDIKSTIEDTYPDLKFDSAQDSSGSFRISTFLQYVIHSRIRLESNTSEYEKGIHVSDIHTIHDGYDSDISRTIRSLGATSRSCFYATLDDDKFIVTFIAPDPQTRNHWLNIFQQLCCTSTDNVKSLWLEKSCKQAGIDQQNGSIQLDQLECILRAAQRLTDKSYLVEIIKVASRATNTGKKNAVAKNASKGNDLIIDAKSLDKLFDDATFRPEIEIIFEKIIRNGDGSKLLDYSTFCEFLIDVQKETDVDVETVKSLIKTYETVLSAKKLTTVGFTNYMLSDKNCIFNYKHTDVYQDMDQPLSHYFISTSHNTYLTKDQLKSKSSVDMYSTALKRGCRCVELDTWDGANNEPVIYHGRTLTSKILFKDVITAVRDHAFTASDYPVILSFENHCSVDQQKVIASHLINILAEKLYKRPIPEDEKQNPSPNDLKGYVIVKYKKLKVGQELAYDMDSSDDDSDEDEEDAPVEDMNGKDEDEEDDDESSSSKKSAMKSMVKDVVKGIKGKKSDKKKDDIPKIAKELSDLVIYCQSVKFKGFEYAKEKSQYYEMSSIGEKKAVKLIKEEGPAFIEYNARQICRTYPAGNRIDSSNYDPHQLWNIGAQMVALNFQTHDRPMQIHQGLFQDNGGSGYILKPEFLRKAELGFDPRGQFDTCTPINIQVISGHQLPYNNEKNVRSERGLSVLVRFSGVEVDNIKDKTKVLKSNGFKVIWNEQLKFRVHVPDVAIVQFTVREGSDSFLGQYSLPVRCMQQGYRTVPLWSKSSVLIPRASLFVNVSIGKQVPSQ